MLESLTGLFGGWMVSPWLFLGGAALVASPIIIHLLNKRKFKTVDWAAMDFLIEADKHNRRRIRLENLILLLLRCLAVLLIGLLVARPYLPLTLTAGLFDAVRYERIVLLDDSPSTDARIEGTSAFEDAKRILAEFVTGLQTNAADDSFTLLLTSQPNRPIFNGVPLNDETASEIKDQIKTLNVSDRSAAFEMALVEVEKSLEGRATEVNRILYIVSDLRHHDWTNRDADEPTAAVEVLSRVSGQTAGCFMIDVAGSDVSNLVVTGVIAQDKALIAGVASRFEVTVKNNGLRDVNQLPVKFSAGDSLALTSEIDNIPAGTEASVPFTYTFAHPDDPLTAVAMDPVPIRAELITSGQAKKDRLQVDNLRYYAARVVKGISTLIVDGDPSASYGRAESFFLARALAPPGAFRSGVDVETVTDVEFETLRLEDYQVIYLCNLYRVSEQRRNTLELWVAAGGGLVITLGDQIDEEFYNTDLHRDGNGLMPAQLGSIRGDEGQSAWVFFRVESANHPVLEIFEGESNPFLDGVKVFRWWECVIPETTQPDRRIVVDAHFSDSENSPAIVEKTFGQGRVFLLTTAVDADWSNWPIDQSYLITTQELNRYMARNTKDRGSVVVGQPIYQPVDLTKYRLDVELTTAAKTQQPIQPAPPDGNREVPEADEAVWTANYEQTDRRGFYQMQLTRNDGEQETKLFAANIDVNEGDLQRIDHRMLRRSLGDAPVEIVTGESLLSLEAGSAQGELWLYVLAMLVVVLCVEQFLGWRFGLRR